VKSLPQNPQLLYALLQNQELFSIESTERFNIFITNINTVITHFKMFLGRSKSQLSSTQVLKLIDEGVESWKPTVLRKFEPILFKYEEHDSNNFFISLAWQLALDALT